MLILLIALSPSTSSLSAYHLSYEVEVHAATTYAKYIAYNGDDEKILEILNDELQHAHELHKAIKLIA